MESDALAIAVAVLYLTSIALIVMTVVRGNVRTRRERERARVIKRLRDPVEACVLEGKPLPRVPADELDALLEVVLRYTSMVRGRDAERLTDCLAEQGVVTDLLQRLRAHPAWRRAEAARLPPAARQDARGGAATDLSPRPVPPGSRSAARHRGRGPCSCSGAPLQAARPVHPPGRAAKASLPGRMLPRGRADA